MDSLIKIYSIGNLRYTPFKSFNTLDFPVFENQDLEITGNIGEA